MHFDLVYYSFTLFQMVTPPWEMHGIFPILTIVYFNLWKGEEPQCEQGFDSTKTKKVWERIIISTKSSNLFNIKKKFTMFYI